MGAEGHRDTVSGKPQYRRKRSSRKAHKNVPIKGKKRAAAWDPGACVLQARMLSLIIVLFGSTLVLAQYRRGSSQCKLVHIGA
jgi:hypothetical protein